MAKNVTKYSIFLASPSDVEEERFAVEEVINELNNSYGSKNNLMIELLKWETHSAPGISSSHPQSLINNDIGYEYDIFLGILWKRFGTPTDVADSGTEEEFKNALARFKKDDKSIQILFYFKDSLPKSMSEINASELKKIEDFKKSIGEEKVLYWKFNSLEEFKNDLRLHIPKRINTLIELNNQVYKEEVTVKSLVINNKESDLGFLDYSEIYENLLGDSLLALNRIAESTKWIGDEFTQKAVEITAISKSPNANRSLITESIKRVAKLMNDYSLRLEVETPIFFNSFEEGIKAGISILNFSDGIYTEQNISELEVSLNSSLSLEEVIPEATSQMWAFYNSVKELPRIQVDINQAKKKMMSKIEDLISKMQKSLDLNREFTNELTLKIIKLKSTSKDDKMVEDSTDIISEVLEKENPIATEIIE